ncbi:prephenate dehydrogenase/arogenate dehydrogenase family protein [Coraliomargarita sp. SDUM461004]|uniref:Prephenate dehydrogenase/arogenate dehydrogenase family protein n=1 Tax=Thalassobacterium sedimentorum TaxID=3041258 RepID=A0ABU1AHR7_9BACT|nr:prephenate dehydrogenase/arogenate dehydrogenase family protein [Coraliomargarita sp. SDUM461004]MDQ8194325.1 prephenate dehydrogenase/arogenate dehydrogenase family protein [Coraliomargarita sp. SDUM461004]
MFQQITILGPGLLGASLALALKERGLSQKVHAWSRRPQTRAQALQTSWCDAVFESPSQACAGSELVVICTPVETIVPLLEQIAPSLTPQTLITDVGSTKSLICREARGTHVNFIGSHPMAGSEQTGMAHARADLFDGAACIITPLDEASELDIARLHQLWNAIGMDVSTCTPEKHDEIVAHISHLPHLIASSLCSYLAGKDSTWKQLSGGGLRDSTRVAAGDPTLWKQILEQNREEVLRAIDGFENELHALKTALLDQNTLELVAQLERGKRFRDSL